jgi:hypothetical protein
MKDKLEAAEYGDIADHFKRDPEYAHAPCALRIEFFQVKESAPRPIHDPFFSPSFA